MSAVAIWEFRTSPAPAEYGLVSDILDVDGVDNFGVRLIDSWVDLALAVGASPTAATASLPKPVDCPGYESRGSGDVEMVMVWTLAWNARSRGQKL